MPTLYASHGKRQSTIHKMHIQDWHVPRESLKGGGKVVRPAKVKNLVVETRDVVAPFRQVEDLEEREGFNSKEVSDNRAKLTM